MTNHENDGYEIVKDEVNTAFKKLYEYNLLEFPEREKNNFVKLQHYKRFIELRGFQQIWWKPYMKTKYYLKELVLNGEINANVSEEEKKQAEEEAFYDWLKVCVNPQNDPNIDFYFKKENLAKEDEVKKILFEQGKLRDMFKENEWQIRLRKIRTWFLKRYDWGTAKKLHCNLTDKSKFEFLDVVFMRLQCATLVGFIPLLFESKTWTLPLKFKWLEIGSISLILFLLTLLYLSYDCSKAGGGERGISTFRRALIVLFVGVLPSLFYSFIFCGILSYYFIDFGEAVYNDFDLLSLGSYLQWGFSLKTITFFASVAFSIGILVQIIWEEKAVTEPL